MFKLSFSVTPADCVILPMFEEADLEPAVKSLDAEHNGIIQTAFETEDFSGKKMQISLLYTHNKQSPRLLLTGLGPKKELTVRRFKQVIGAAIIAAQSKKAQKISVLIPKEVITAFDPTRAISQATVAATVAAYSFDEYKQKDTRVSEVTSITFFGAFESDAKKILERAVAEGKIIGEAINYTRHLGNVPPTIMTPAYLAQSAIDLAQKHPNIKVKVLSRPEMKKLGMGCLLGVAQGSAKEPKFIILEYFGLPQADSKNNKKTKPIVLAGKGITYDSGGLSIKPSNYMNDMKFDMLGAASVLGVILALAELKIKKNVVGLLPSCENMPDGDAYRPDDILVAMDGTSVHITNTDAEGRLILADALCYAAKYEPKEVIDLATLTGHCRVALVMDRSGLFTTEEKMAEKLLVASGEVGEQLWRLPLGEEFTEGNKSEVADIDNSGVGDNRLAGASVAAAFLQYFVKYPWAHIDMSCCYYTPKGRPWIRAGANGFGVETLVEYIRN